MVLILISFSGNTQYILDNIVIAKKKHVPLLALTNYMNSPLAQSAECVLKTTADEQKIRLGAMDSTISQFLVIDLLSSMLAARISEQTEKRILQIFETVKKSQRLFFRRHKSCLKVQLNPVFDGFTGIQHFPEIEQTAVPQYID